MNGDDLCRRSICMSTELSMALKGATWPSDLMSLFGSHDRNKSPTVGSRDHFPLQRHSWNWGCHGPADTLVSSLLQIGSGCWFFVRHPNFPLGRSSCGQWRSVLPCRFNWSCRQRSTSWKRFFFFVRLSSDQSPICSLWSSIVHSFDHFFFK